MKLLRTSLIAALLGATGAQAPTTLQPGDLWFTGMARESAYGGWSFVSFVDILAGTTLTFSDVNLNANGSFKTSAQRENSWTWTATSDLAAGTQVVIYSGNYNLATSALTGASSGQGAKQASSGSISAAPTADGLAYQFDFSSSGEVLYALQGGSFIAAMNSFVAPPSSSTDNPLASGLGFIQNLNDGPAHGGSGDGAVQRTEWYVGPTTGLTADAYKAAIADMRNWDKDTGTSAFKALILLEGGLVPLVSGGDALGRGAGNFDIVSSPVPEPTSALLLGGGLLAIALKRRRG